MNRSLSLVLCMLCASSALAEPTPSPQSAATALIEAELLAPLREVELKRSPFSRVPRRPLERTLRVVERAGQVDAQGRTFLSFAIDVRKPSTDGSRLEKNAIVGCVYVDQREVYVRAGARYQRAKDMLAKSEVMRRDVCRAAGSR
ncbi:MAG: hypothetical protein RL385_4149 [Pseudomonadota bacterium]|jgi:hypothetical protein